MLTVMSVLIFATGLDSTALLVEWVSVRMLKDSISIGIT
tara:strand:- start:580 stop:696 length:117 start_codon:yes stop_codon:yes gene_type:complete